MLHTAFDGPEDAPVLVLANSIGTDLGVWEPQLRALAASHRVLRYDHRGHGRSPATPGPYTVEGLARDLLDVLGAHAIERVSFCGLSLGAAVGTWIAIHVPQRIDRLILASAAARFGTPEGWSERARTVRARGMAAIADRVVNEIWFTSSFRQRSPDVVDRHRRMFEATAPEGYAACCDALEAWEVRAPELSSISAPTLLIAGADDPATPPSSVAALHEHIGGSRLVVLDHAAHLANVEQPSVFATVVREHLDTHVETPSHA